MISSIPPVARIFPLLPFINAAHRTIPTCASYAYTSDIPPSSNRFPSTDLLDALLNISDKDCVEGSTIFFFFSLFFFKSVGSHPYIHPSYVPNVILILLVAIALICVVIYIC